ncbi:RIMS-binding protein 2-like isoform X2 [Dendronephthya gigantea]|uniref:RIMS-binding protein 2-like isoform X2 n=1 Tax=Dendronephthya gigantea TaxID=151771 RepID=UPI00106BC549|nr:RIMS-binding protein 2-like isoform X2 [Dendronephthya gigantea]
MASRIPLANENSHGGAKKVQNQQGGSSNLWGNQDEMRRYVSKLKSELAEQKNRVKRVHRDKSEEIKRLQENLDHEKQKAIENVSKKLESDKVYELKKMKESVAKQKEHELRQVLRVKDEEMRTLKQELQESKNTTRILEVENKRILSEQSRGVDTNDNERRWKGEVSSLRNDKKRLEESLRIKSEADFEKAELIRKLKQEHDLEIRRLTRESKRESMKEFRQLKAVSKEVELKNHQLAAKEAEMRRLERERNNLGNELNLQRRDSLKKSNSFNSQKVKGLSASQNSESDIDNVAEERIKKLKMRNSELVAIARKLEEKAKHLQEEKDLLEKSSGMNNSDVGNLKKAFARQRAKDLAERAKLLMNKDNEINNLKKEVEETRHNGFNENGSADELEKIVEQTSKERLLLEKQVSSNVENLREEIKDISAQNTRLANDNDILKEEVCKLQDFKSKHDTISTRLKEVQARNEKLENACSEKDKWLYKLDLEKQAFTAKNNALQKKNNELLSKVDQLNQVERECSHLKESIQTLENENLAMKEENVKLGNEIKDLSEVKKEAEQLKLDNMDLEKQRENVSLKLEERDQEISSLYEAQEVAQRNHSAEVSGLEDMVRRLKEQKARSIREEKIAESRHTTSSVLTSTPKDSKSTQTSRPSSPVMSPIIHNGIHELQRDSQKDEDIKGTDDDSGQELLNVPYNGTSSSTSFDLEKAGTRIQQLAASDSDEIDSNFVKTQKQSPVSSEISESSEPSVEDQASEEDKSYSADVSQASDVEELRVNKTLQDDEQESDFYDPRDDPDIYIGSPLQNSPDLEEKLSIFIAKYNYDPMLYSPNENPEMELAFQAGDYLYVYGDVDGDGFYVGELMNGERGLVPSNFVEQIAEEEAILKESDDLDADSDSEERRHEMFRSSLDHVLTEQLDDIRESEEDDLGTSYLSEDELGNRKNQKNKSNKPEADQVSSDGLDSMDSDVPEPRVPSPTKLSLDRQFTNSALISWRGAQLPNDEIQGYNVYVDGKFKTQIKGSKKTNVVVEDIKPTETYRVSVRTNSVSGVESPDTDATMVFGPDATLSPSNLDVTKITATSGELQWLPSHSCYQHEIFLNETLLENVKAGCSSFAMNDLSPSTQYHIRVRTVIPDHLEMSGGKLTEKDLSAEVEFTTADGGLPEPPVDLRLSQRTSENVVLTWLPVTLSLDGYSNGYKVSGYKIYVNDIYCTEIVSACVDSIAIPVEKLRNLGKRHDFSRMRFVVRTLSVLGESLDSNAVEIWSEDHEIEDRTCGKVEGAVLSNSDFPKNIDEGNLLSDGNAIVSSDLANSLEANSTALKSKNNSELPKNSVGESWSDKEGTRNQGAFSSNESDQEDSGDGLHQATSSKDSTSESRTSRKSNVSEVTELNSGSKDDNENVKDGGLGKDTTNAADVPPTLVRRPPIVNRYDVETESESYSTESKTMDTEDELIERFEHFEISGKNEVDVAYKNDEDYKNMNELPECDTLSGNHPETKENTSNTEPCEGEDIRRSDGINTDSSPQSNGISQNNLGTDHRSSGSEADSEKKEDKNRSKDFQAFIQNAVSDDMGSGAKGSGPTLTIGPPHSESETDTEYGPPLSVIHEVDEDNLTETNSPTSQDKTSDDEATLCNKQLTSLPDDHSRNSDITGSRSRTLTSDDEGFRTEDDVLDLLDGEDDAMIDEPKGDNTTSTTKKGQSASTSRVDKGNFRTTSDNRNDIDNRTIGSNDKQTMDNAGILRDRSVQEDKIDGVTQENETDLDSVNLTEKASGNTQVRSDDNSSKGEEVTVNCHNQDNTEPNSDGNKTEDEESTENISESSCPTRASLRSDSSLSEEPPAAENALEAIIATLSFPDNCRGTVQTGSDGNENIPSGSERTSEVVSAENRSDSEGSEVASEQVRYYIALYRYDPMTMSPNVDGADEELPFNEGDIIRVIGDVDDDGFLWGECKLKQGLVPSNMVSEVDINEAEDLFNEDTNDVRLQNELNSHDQVNGELDVDIISQNLGETGTSGDRLSFWENLESDDLGPRKMKALYDYDPLSDSPNVDSEVELKFKSGEIIFVFGEIHDDGFFDGELNGIRGLVPSNFLKPVEEINHVELLANEKTSDSKTKSPSNAQEQSLNNLNHSPTEDGGIPHKKRKNIFSKGKKMFKKAFK